MKASLPFGIDRADSKSLIGQMVDGIKAAVASGYYQPGEKLPSVRALAELAGVSLIVPRLAIRQLEREEVVTTRPRIGTLVCDAGGKRWRGRILFVVPETDGNFMINIVTGEMRKRLAVHGYHLERVTVPMLASGKYDFTFLDLALRMRTDLVVVAFRRAGVISKIQSLRVPFVVMGEIGNGSAKGAAGVVGITTSAASREFARQCRVRGVKHVMQVGFCQTAVSVKTRILEKAGVACDTWVIRYTGDCRRHDMVGMSVAAAFEKRLAGGRDWLPDVFYFNDDFVASGALMALAHHCVRIPEDVKVVSFANLGLGPVFYRKLTAFECDSFRYGESIASVLLRFLEDGEWPGDLLFDVSYVPGETFS